MFERYTERARQVIVLGQDEARLLKHNYIGTEHLLLGLLREEEGLAARTLEHLDVDVESVRRWIAKTIGVGDEVTTGQIPFTPRSKKVLELSLREALSLGHNYIGTEHILLGMVREGEGIACRYLSEELAVTADTVRNEVIRQLSPRKPSATTQTATVMPHENGSKPLRDALQGIVAVLGPTADCPHIKCEGCQAEMAEALRLAQEALA